MSETAVIQAEPQIAKEQSPSSEGTIVINVRPSNSAASITRTESDHSLCGDSHCAGHLDHPTSPPCAHASPKEVCAKLEEPPEKPWLSERAYKVLVYSSCFAAWALGLWATAWLSICSIKPTCHVDRPDIVAAICVLSVSVFYCVAVLLKMLCFDGYLYVISDDGKHPN